MKRYLIFDKARLYIIIEPDTTNDKVLITTNESGICLSCKSDWLINSTDLENIYTEPNKVHDNTIELYIIYCIIIIVLKHI